MRIPTGKGQTLQGSYKHVIQQTNFNIVSEKNVREQDTASFTIKRKDVFRSGIGSWKLECSFACGCLPSSEMVSRPVKCQASHLTSHVCCLNSCHSEQYKIWYLKMVPCKPVLEGRWTQTRSRDYDSRNRTEDKVFCNEYRVFVLC